MEKQRLINSKLVVEFCSSSWQLQIENRIIIFIITRPKSAVQDGIVGPPGCGSGRHNLGCSQRLSILPMSLTSEIFAQMQFCRFFGRFSKLVDRVTNFCNRLCSFPEHFEWSHNYLTTILAKNVFMNLKIGYSCMKTNRQPRTADQKP